MRRSVALIVALAGLLSPGSDAATYYSGDGDGITVEMRVRRGMVVHAKVSTTLYCTPRPGFGPVGEPHTEPFLFYMGGHPDDFDYRQPESVPIDRRGGFMDRHESSGLDETGSDELVFGGRISSRSVRGHFLFHARYDEGCRTGGFLEYGDRDRDMETLGFKATRGQL
jgi:hypothetical protein